jgi:hypothetical protein
LVVTPRSPIAWLSRGVGGHDPELRGRGFRRSGWPPSQSLRRRFHPVVGRIICASCRGVSGRWAPYRASPLGGVVLFVLRGTRMASDRTEVIVVHSVLTGSVRRAYSCQSKHTWLGPTSPRSSQGSGRWRGREFLVRHAAKSERRGRG